MLSNYHQLRTATLAAVCDRYFFELEIGNRSPRTVEVVRYQFKRFIDWCSERGITLASELSDDALQAYRTLCRWMFNHKFAFAIIRAIETTLNESRSQKRPPELRDAKRILREASPTVREASHFKVGQL